MPPVAVQEVHKPSSIYDIKKCVIKKNPKKTQKIVKPIAVDVNNNKKTGLIKSPSQAVNSEKAQLLARLKVLEIENERSRETLKLSYIMLQEKEMLRSNNIVKINKI